MPYPTTTWTTPAAPTTTWTSGPTQSAPGCELKVAVGGGQRWIIEETFDWICRINIPIYLLGSGTQFTQTP